MKTQLSEIERLDVAARGLVADRLFWQLRISFALLGAITISLATVSTNSPFGTLLVRMLAAFTTFSAIALWSHLRFAVHAAAAVFFAFALGMMILRFHDPARISGWVVGYAASFVPAGYRLWRNAIPFAAAQQRGWEQERRQVRQWIKALENCGTEERVFQFDTGNFWQGYFTYRLMNHENCWVIARWKKNSQRLLDYRVRGTDSVRIKALPGEALEFQFEDRSLGSTWVPADVRNNLLRLSNSSSPSA